MNSKHQHTARFLRRGTQFSFKIDDAENQDFKALAKDVFEMFVNEEKVLTKSRVVENIIKI